MKFQTKTWHRNHTQQFQPVGKRKKLETLFENNLLEMKRTRTTKHKNTEEALLKLFKYQRTNNVPKNELILQ